MFPFSWIARINIVKMAVFLKASYRCNTIPIKIPMIFFPEIGKIILKFIWKQKNLGIIKAILSKKNAFGSITVSLFKLYCIIIVEIWYWHTKGKSNRINSINGINN